MIISMVMVMDRNRLIGSNGKMPWHLPAELKYFKKVTMGKPMIMGRKTYDSIGRPLPGRTSIVVTRNQSWPADGGHNEAQQQYLDNGQLRVASTFDAAVAIAGELLAEKQTGQGGDGESTGEAEVAVIGGADICKLAMPLCKRLYLTVIDAEFEGDTWLTSFERDDWSLASETTVTVDGYSLSYQVLER